MLKDEKVLLSLIGLAIFTTLWGIMEYFKVPADDGLLKFVETGATTSFSALMLFIKTDGQYPNAPAAPAPAASPANPS